MSTRSEINDLRQQIADLERRLKAASEKIERKNLDRVESITLLHARVALLEDALIKMGLPNAKATIENNNAISVSAIDHALEPYRRVIKETYGPDGVG